MTFSQSKQMLLRPQKEKRLFTFLVALFTAACLFVPYMVMSEGYFTFYGDFNVQQIPFYQMCHEAIRTGDVNWSWLTDLGSDFVGSYAFYLLGSPFFWITLLFPNSFVPHLMGPLLILKFACAALTGYLYIRRFTKTAYAASLGGLLYAFSGFSIYNIFFNHFHEAIIAFPLLLLGVELLITENRRGVFALSVAFCAITNYFFFFGMVVFCVIYFFVRLFSNAIKVKFSRFLVFAFEAVLGLALSAALLVPALNAIMGNSRITNILMGWNGITYGKEQIYLNVIQCFFFPPDLPARPVFFPEANVKWSSLGGWLPVFSMTGFFTWFKLREKSWLKRVLAICVLCAMVPILNSAFYAFNTSYYARWFYMPVLMISLATVMLTEDKSVNFGSGLRWTAAITLAFVLVIGFFPQKVTEDGVEKLIFGLYTQSETGMYIARFWITALIALVCLPMQKLLFDTLKNNRTKFYKGAIACVCIISIIYGNVFIATGRTHSYEIKDVMIDSLIEGEVYIDDDSEFRIDVYDGVDNTGMYLGLPTINAFHSVVSPSIMEFYDYIGVERSVASRPDTDIPAIR
ncbi:MAG: YfhO family protein, partial [Clostridia bacterium]|nr:YfhO family protein [Clostridia bacterium]